jgi:hypothetical protein
MTKADLIATVAKGYIAKVMLKALNAFTKVR